MQHRILTIATYALLLVAAFNPLPAAAAPMPLALSISAPHGPFRSGGPMPVTLRLSNVSKKPLVVNARLAVNDVAEPAAFREVTFTVARAGQPPLPFRLDIKIGAATARDARRLPPGAAVTKTVDLAKYFELSGAGSYTVQAEYANAMPGVPSGPVRSNSLHLTVQ